MLPRNKTTPSGVAVVGPRGTRPSLLNPVHGNCGGEVGNRGRRGWRLAASVAARVALEDYAGTIYLSNRFSK